MRKQIAKCTGFDWDEWNSEKNLIRHGVSDSECEQTLLNRTFYGEDKKHSKKEKRYYALGPTDRGRLLTVNFTIRNDLFRVISARDMNNKEKRVYHEKVKRSSRL